MQVPLRLCFSIVTYCSLVGLFCLFACGRLIGFDCWMLFVRLLSLSLSVCLPVYLSVCLSSRELLPDSIRVTL